MLVASHHQCNDAPSPALSDLLVREDFDRLDKYLKLAYLCLYFLFVITLFSSASRFVFHFGSIFRLLATAFFFQHSSFN